LPSRENREWQEPYDYDNQYRYRSGGWFGFGAAAERSYASSPYRPRSPYRGFDHADGIW
jgi:hypothetical protein